MSDLFMQQNTSANQDQGASRPSPTGKAAANSFSRWMRDCSRPQNGQRFWSMTFFYQTGIVVERSHTAPILLAWQPIRDPAPDDGVVMDEVAINGD